MKRYEAVMGKYAGLPYVETNECSDGRFVLYSEAQAEIETIKDQRDVLLMALNATLIELTHTANQLEQLTDLKKGSAIIEAIEQAKAAIAKVRTL